MITPGPWKIHEPFSPRNIISDTHYIAFAEVMGSCKVNPNTGRAYPDYGEAKANARLIAAAPELLEALKAINSHWESGNFSRQPHLWEPMRKAIARATSRNVP